MILFLLVALSYLAGGIPTGYIAARRLRGVNILEEGSGNPGAGNVYRVCGPLPGAITLLGDSLKGFLPVLLAGHLYPADPVVPVLCGAAAIVGHDWTVFLGFRGGKGVATTAGVFLALLPRAALGSVCVFILGVWTTGHISVGSIAGTAAFPFLAHYVGAGTLETVFASGACLLILYKHIPNMKRLLGKKELYFHAEKY